jgi:RNA polymerase sigma factor (sigma-70 family)
MRTELPTKPGRFMSKRQNDTIEAAYRDSRKVLIGKANKSLRNKNDAEDALQDVFLRILANADIIDSITNLPALVYTMLKRRIIDLWRRSRMQRKAGETDVAEQTIEEIVSAIGFDPLDTAIRSELAEALDTAIGELPPEQQAVIEAQVIDGMTFAELSERTGLSINTLMTRKRIAIKRLAEALRGWIEED